MIKREFKRLTRYYYFDKYGDVIREFNTFKVINGKFEKIEWKRNNSKKKQILTILVSFSIFVAVFVGLIAMINFYLSKLDIIEHNQKQVFYQVESEIDKFWKIYKLASYVKLIIQRYKIIKNIVDTNTNISGILVLNKME